MKRKRSNKLRARSQKGKTLVKLTLQPKKMKSKKISSKTTKIFSWIRTALGGTTT